MRQKDVETITYRPTFRFVVLLPLVDPPEEHLLRRHEPHDAIQVDRPARNILVQPMLELPRRRDRLPAPQKPSQREDRALIEDHEPRVVATGTTEKAPPFRDVDDELRFLPVERRTYPGAPGNEWKDTRGAVGDVRPVGNDFRVQRVGNPIPRVPVSECSGECRFAGAGHPDDFDLLTIHRPSF